MRHSRQIIRKKYKYPHEVFTEIEKTQSFHDRVQYLKDNASPAIRIILQYNFSSSIHIDLPYGPPPFTRDTMPFGNSLGRIDKAIKVLEKITLAPGQNPASGIARLKKETRFVQLLEAINEKDADIIIAMKDKMLQKLFPSVEESLVRAAFPEILN